MSDDNDNTPSEESDEEAYREELRRKGGEGLAPRAAPSTEEAPLSPTVEHWATEKPNREVPDTCCTTCPAAMWRNEGKLAAYCRMMGYDTYSAKRPLVLVKVCDGPLLWDAD